MVAAPVYSLKHFLYLMERIRDAEHDPYPFYAVLLYAPINGLDARLHEYMAIHWILMDAMTGPKWLLLAAEDFEWAKPSIDDFKPEDIYHIARELGQPPNTIPCLVFFANPKYQNDVLTLNLREFFGEGGLPSDEDLTDFFRSITSIVESCSDKPPGRRLQCLDKMVSQEWPRDSVWAERARKAAGWVVVSATTASTVVTALTPALQSLSRLFGG